MEIISLNSVKCSCTFKGLRTFALFTAAWVVSSTANSKLNNYTRIEPTLQLLGVPFDLGFAQALMQERPGAATRLLYQLYIQLQKKKRAGLTGVAMETMQPAATARLHRVEREIYNERLRAVVQREAHRKLQKISHKYELQGQKMFHRSTMAQYEKQQELQRIQEEMRVKDIEKHRLAHRRQHEIMTRIQIPKPPLKPSVQHLELQRKEREPREAQDVQREISQFERNLKKQFPAFSFSSSAPCTLVPEELALANDRYILKIRERLEEDAAARAERERRRGQALLRQLQAHEEQQEMMREQQLVARMTHHTKQEQRIAVQLMQLRQQKEVLRQNRIFRERQYQERRLRDFQEALDREAALSQQCRLEHAEEIRKEKELHERMVAERAQARYGKHFDACTELLWQIVDLATRVGEYRLFTANRIPAKLLREWKELLFHGLPLYDGGAVSNAASEAAHTSAEERAKLELLNNQDYDEYTSMTGNWVWPEDSEQRARPPSSHILAHVVHRLQAAVEAPAPPTLPHFVLGFTLKACILGKIFAGKTTCLSRIAQAHGIHVLSANKLIQEALQAFRVSEVASTGLLKDSEPLDRAVSPSKDAEQVDKDGDLSQDIQQHVANGKEGNSKLSLRAQLGATAEKVLRKGKALSDELFVDIVVEAIRRVPSESGWILDGFPTSLNQAKLLEKVLSGVDPDKPVKKARTRETSLAMEPKGPTEAPPPLPAPVLDVVVLLDVSDRLVLARAAEQTHKHEDHGPEQSEYEAETALKMEEESAKTHPQQEAPPLEIRQVQHRITAFLDNWSKLEKWYGTRQNVLVKLSAEGEPDMVFKKVESILYKTMLQQADRGSQGSDDSTKEGEAQEELPDGQNKLTGHGPLSGGPQAQPTMMKLSVPEDPRARSPALIELLPSQAEDIVYADEPLPREIPEYLAPYWQNVCTSYVTNMKTVMQSLRGQHMLIVQHLYNMREEFKLYVRRPDLKQEFVVQWQQEFNLVADDMRGDEETKAEMYLRLDELRERLWDICERRRQEAQQEREAVMGDGWRGDHMAMLLNHFGALMQVELDRFQDTVFLLRGYYRGMSGQLPAQSALQFARVPMLDVREHEVAAQAVNAAGSVQPDQQNRDHEQMEDKRPNIIPLIPRRPLSTETGVMKHKVPMEMNEEERLLDHIWQSVLTAVNDMVLMEAQQREAEEKTELQRGTEQQGQRRPSQASANTQSKEKKKSGKKKGAPSPVRDVTPPPAVQEDEAEVHRRAVRARIRQEHAAALHQEDHRVRVRLELIRARALGVVRDLQQQATDMYHTMHEELGSRFLAEMTSVDKLVDVAGHHIEAGTRIEHQLALEAADFFINEDMRVVPCTVPPPRPPPRELPMDSTPTVLQLESLFAQIHKAAPTGHLCIREFSEILQGIISLDIGGDTLPEPWMHVKESQIQALVSAVSLDPETLDWRKFLLSAALPWPCPSHTQLLEVLARFRVTDSQGTGLITEEQYLQTELWFPSESSLSPPHEPSKPMPYDRLAHLRKFFFTLFADHTVSPPSLDYETMLLYFAAHPDCRQGWVRALSVVTGQFLCYKPQKTLLEKSVPHIGDMVDEVQTEGLQELPATEEGGTVSIPALLKVVCHGGLKNSSQKQFQPAWKNWDEDFRKLYLDLGFGTEDQIPFSTLCQHPLVQQLMENSLQYQLYDIHRVLQNKLGEDEYQSSFLLS